MVDHPPAMKVSDTIDDGKIKTKTKNKRLLSSFSAANSAALSMRDSNNVVDIEKTLSLTFNTCQQVIRIRSIGDR
jgi:hypothetical protein